VPLTRYRDKRPRDNAPPPKKLMGLRSKKTKRVVDDVEPVAKKKKKKDPVTALAVLDRRSEIVKKASTTFGVPSKQLYTMIQDGNVDQAIIVFQRQMLATVLRLIPIAENQYRKEKKEHTAYALNSLVSQARELSADIQASADRASVAEIIVTEYMMPTFRSLIETLVVETQALKAVLKSKVRTEAASAADTAVDELVRQVARSGNELFRVNAEAIRGLLGAPKKRGVKA